MFGFFRRSAPPSSPELGTLGTHAYAVTDWEPGPTTWRPVMAQDGTSEPLRRTRAVRGPLALQADRGIPLFQGERAPGVEASADVSAENDALEAFIGSLSQVGYPS